MLQTHLRMPARVGTAAWMLGLTLLVAASSAFADEPPAAPVAAPPSLQAGTPSQDGTPAPAKTEPSADAGTSAGTGTRAPDLDDVPSTEPIAPARTISSQPQVEQKRDGSRHVSEVIVVPAGTNIHYSLINREGQRPTSPLATTPGGLSTQRFFRLDF